MGHDHQSTTTYLVSAVIVLGFLALRMSRARTARPMNLRTWWATPALTFALLGGGAVAMLVAGHVDVDALSAAIMIGALALGSGAGWWRGRFMAIELDAATQKPMVRASGAAFAVIAALFVLRMGAKMLFLADADPRAPATTLLNVDFALFGLGVLAVARVEMWLRARKLVAGGTTTPTTTSTTTP